ncbi:MAG: hypothetical protein ACRC46_11875 [Thermoguttaceae bacterium]
MKHTSIRQSLFFAFAVLLLASTAASVALAQGGGKSQWVSVGGSGKLVYKATPTGDRIMDFSSAGYKGGGVAIPVVAVKETVSHPGNLDEDCTALIQSAIDRVARLPLDSDGFRGAVLLGPGEYLCGKSISVHASGIVLRGSGREAGETGTTIRMAGNKKYAAITASVPRNTASGEAASRGIRGVADRQEAFSTMVTDSYVPAGTYSFSIADVSGFNVGDWVEIQKIVTKEWGEFMGMHNLVRDGNPQTWISAGTVIPMTRQIKAIQGKNITVEVPLSDSYDTKYLTRGIPVVKVDLINRLTQVGIENLRIVSPEQAVNHTQELYNAIRLNGVDCWIRDVQIEETMNSVGVTGHRITIQKVDIIRRAHHQGASKPGEFWPNAGQVLLDRCSVEGNNIWFIAFGGRICGPMVVLNCEFKGDGHVEGHQRWTTGILYDNCRLPDGGLDLKNRGSMGSGHGWGTGWSVAWNCLSKTIVNQQPPGCYNWVIGCAGKSTPLPRPFDRSPVLPLGVFDSENQPVAPQSLYLTQLKERLGPSALNALGYKDANLTY